MTAPRIIVLALMLAACAASPAQAGHANVAAGSPETTVNSQITDSVTQANVQVLGEAPAVAMGNLFVATSQALSNAAHDATSAQQQSYVTMQASTTQAVSLLLALGTSSTSACRTYLTARLLATCLATGA